MTTNLLIVAYFATILTIITLPVPFVAVFSGLYEMVITHRFYSVAAITAGLSGTYTALIILNWPLTLSLTVVFLVTGVLVNARNQALFHEIVDRYNDKNDSQFDYFL